VKPAVSRLHAVTDQSIATLPKLESLARSLAISPSVTLHARIPHADGRLIHNLVSQFQRAAAPTGAAVFVNDRVDIARMANATGAHLPGDGLPIKPARALLTSDQLLGRSVHASDDARRALDEGADYVFLGPIWETTSHPGRRALGLGVLEGLESLPVIAIGGVTVERARQCHEAGVWGVAAISALWRSPDPAAAARAMLLSFNP
jgi:thiamine-phosphate pyrophosphorylase